MLKRDYNEKFQNFVNDLSIRGYSKETIKNYVYYNTKFLEKIKKSVREISSRDIRSYLLQLKRNGLRERTINMAYNSLKAYYNGFLGKKLFYKIKRSKVPKHKYDILRKEDILNIISNIKNEKHRLLIILLYSSGLRVSECLRIKVEDINFYNKLIHIKKGKGMKDRFVITSDFFIRRLSKYLDKINKKSGYIFENKNQMPLTTRSAQEILKKAKKISGIKQKVYPHLLRACFATHLIEKGTSIQKVQKIMGHSHYKTTLNYAGNVNVDIMDVKSPLD